LDAKRKILNYFKKSKMNFYGTTLKTEKQGNTIVVKMTTYINPQ
jgi:hypothetical protein